jgi:hypothetical protein
MQGNRGILDYEKMVSAIYKQEKANMMERAKRHFYRTGDRIVRVESVKFFELYSRAVKVYKLNKRERSELYKVFFNILHEVIKTHEKKENYRIKTTDKNGEKFQPGHWTVAVKFYQDDYKPSKVRKRDNRVRMGRATKRLNVNLEEDMHADLKVMCHSDGISLSEFVRRAIVRYKEEKMAES